MINQIKTSLYLILFSSLNLYAQIVDGAFITSINSNTYEVTIAINLQSGIGSAGVIQIEFTYNSTALNYPNSPVKNTDYILHGDFDLYVTQNVTKPDSNSVRISLLTLGTPSPVPIDTVQTLLVTYYFTITNSQGTSNLTWTQTDVAPEFLQPNYQIGHWSNLDELLGITSVNNNQFQLNSYILFQNFPNPFNPTTIIQYRIVKTSFVTLNVFDLLGKEVTVLVMEYKQPGNYDVEFNGNNLTSGIYIYKLRVNDFVSSKKMILMK